MHSKAASSSPRYGLSMNDNRRTLAGLGASPNWVRLRRCGFAVAALVSCAVAWPVAAGEAQADRIAWGQAIAEAKCSVCHATGAAGESPAPANADTPFRRLHERYPIPMLVEAAQTGDISGHDEMPGFHFSLEEVTALLAYIDSLAPEKPAYVPR